MFITHQQIYGNLARSLCPSLLWGIAIGSAHTIHTFLLRLVAFMVSLTPHPLYGSLSTINTQLGSPFHAPVAYVVECLDRITFYYCWIWCWYVAFVSAMWNANSQPKWRTKGFISSQWQLVYYTRGFFGKKELLDICLRFKLPECSFIVLCFSQCLSIVYSWTILYRLALSENQILLMNN